MKNNKYLDQEILSDRVGIYSLLRTLYSYPISKTSLDYISNLEADKNLSFQDGLKKMQSSLQHEQHLNEILDRLNIEMTQLLEGPGLPKAPPFASFYLNNKMLMGPSAVSARNFYLKWLVVPSSNEINIPSDHIALELGFMAHLGQRMMEGDEKALLASKDFINQNLVTWVNKFCDTLSLATSNEFYKGLADVTKTVVQNDVLMLDELINEVEAKTNKNIY